VSRSEAHSIKGVRSKVNRDRILSVIRGVSLFITQNIDTDLGLVNGVMIEFYGFANREGALIDDEIISTQPAICWSSQEAEWRLFRHILAVRAIMCQNSRPLSILRPFNTAELRSPFSKDILAVLHRMASSEGQGNRGLVHVT
jgi:hypothetical protein